MDNILEEIDVKGIVQFKNIKYSDGCRRAELGKSNETFAVIYNCGETQSFTIGGIPYHLKANEMLVVVPFIKCGEVELGKKASFYWLEFLLTTGFLGLDEQQVSQLIRDFKNYVLTKQRGSDRLRQLFRNLFIKDESFKILRQTYVESVLLLIIAELLRSSMFQNIKGADWKSYNADALQAYIENNGPALAVTIRFDYLNKIGNMEMTGSTQTFLASKSGEIFYTEHPYGSHTYLIPEGFKGFAVIPLKKEFKWLDNSPDSKKMYKDFHEMKRIIYFFYGYTDCKEPAPLTGGEEFSIGALTLIDYEIVRSGEKEFIKTEAVKSLAYSDDKGVEERYLEQYHMSNVFNEQYYKDNGMEVFFQNRLIRLKQIRKGYPFVCLNIGCDPFDITEYPPDIKRAVNYIKSHPAENHSIERLSKISYLSESRFKQKFKEVMGMTPIKFAEKCRIEIACKLILSDKSLTQIAYDLNYSSAAHFSYAFKKETGQTPSQYRKNNIIK